MLVCFLGIESLGFSEFQHGTKKPYQLVCGRFFGKIFLHLKIGEMGQKEAKKRVFLFWDIGWNAFSCSGCEILNQTFLQSKSMKQPHFFVCWYKFTKIKIWLKSFWWGMVKKSVANLFLEELMELTDFLHAFTVSHKLKGDWKFFGLAWWKMGVASHRNKKMNRWNKVIYSMLVRIQESQKSIQLFLGWCIEKWPWLFSSWDPRSCCTLKVNIWIELIFWMLIVMQ